MVMLTELTMPGEQSFTTSLISAMFSMLVSVLGGLSYIGYRAQKQQANRHIQESQERLTEAESNLVSALRHQSVSATGQRSVAHGRAVIVTGDDMIGDLPTPNAHAPSHDNAPRDGDTSSGTPAASEAHAAHLALPELWATTHARLKLYHDVALGQADRSFRSAQTAMWASFVAFGGFVAVAFYASTTAGSIVAGGLGAVSAALAGFIGLTFVRSQEAAAEHLRSYFDQPLELSRYLAAERLIADAALNDEQRAEILNALVTAMVAGPPQPPVDPAVPNQVGFPQQVAR